MKESLRQDYLGALGIDLWYAQRPLPGAARSPAFHLDKPQAEPEQAIAEENTPTAAPPPSRGVQGRSAGTSGKKQKPEKPRLIEALSRPEPGPKPDTHKSGAPKISQERPDVDPVVDETFDLGVWIGATWLLIADWKKDAGAELQHQLATNILRALGDMPKAEPGRLLWPAFSHREIPGRSVRHLQAVVQHLLGEAPGAERQLLVLGTQSQALTGNELLFEARAIHVRQPFTLSDMAADGQLKRQLWHSIQAFVRGH